MNADDVARAQTAVANVVMLRIARSLVDGIEVSDESDALTAVSTCLLRVINEEEERMSGILEGK